MTAENVGIVISITALLAVVGLIFKFGKWYGEVNSDQARFSDFIKEIRKDIKDILSRLPPAPTTGSSPIQLTEIGERISNHISAKEWAATEADNLAPKTKDMNAFEIQTLSFDHAKSFEPDASLLSKMQESAFESGINLEGVKEVLGVELRDCLLQMNDFNRSSIN